MEAPWRLGLTVSPRKTIATAQTLYMRFHLFFPYKDFRYMVRVPGVAYAVWRGEPILTTQEVCLSTLYVASKLHDTLKKPRDIILASYPLRFPHLVKKSSGGGGTLDAAAIDAHAVEQERSRVLGIERLVLEGVCFMFGVDGMEGVVRIARGLGCKCARTVLDLQRPHYSVAADKLISQVDKDLTRAAWRMRIDW